VRGGPPTFLLPAAAGTGAVAAEGGGAVPSRRPGWANGSASSLPQMLPMTGWLGGWLTGWLAVKVVGDRRGGAGVHGTSALRLEVNDVCRVWLTRLTGVARYNKRD